jgi:putative transposase
MRNSYYGIYLHAIWSTKNKEPMIKKELEESIHKIMYEKAIKYKTSVIAIGNTMDHMHLLLSICPETNIALLIKEMKGASSYNINHNTEGNLYWQDGYGVLSVSQSGIEIVKRYIENQKQHHASSDIIQVLEKHHQD